MLTGRSKAWERVADSGHKATYQFCPDCGSTIAYIIEGWPGVVAVPVGAFSDPTFPTQNSRSTSTVSTRGSRYWAKTLSIPVRQVSCATLAQRSPHQTPDDRGQPGFKRSSVDPPHPRPTIPSTRMERHY